MHLVCRNFFLRARIAIEMVQPNSYTSRRSMRGIGRENARGQFPVMSGHSPAMKWTLRAVHAEPFARRAGTDAVMAGAVGVMAAPVEFVWSPVGFVAGASTLHAAGDATKCGADVFMA